MQAWSLVTVNHIHDDFHLAVIIQTVIFGMGLIFTNVSLRFLAKSNVFTEELLTIERKRDLQANLICAWLSVDVNASIASNYITGMACFMNASSLPVYNVSYKLMYRKGDLIAELSSRIRNEGNITKVIPPTLNPRTIWVIEGYRDPVGERIRSTDFLSVSKLTTDYYSLSDLNMTETDLSTVTIEILFRCADGSEYRRDELGILYQLS